MKKIIIVPVLFTLLVACKKEKKTETKAFLSEVVSTTNKKLVAFEYTDDNRIKKAIVYDTVTGEPQVTTTYDYTGSTVLKNIRYGFQSDTVIYYLNPSGYATKAIYLNYGLRDTSLIEYDNEGYLSKIYVTASKTVSILFENEQGKRLSVTQPENINRKEIYEYYDFKDVGHALSLIDKRYLHGVYGDVYNKELFFGKQVEYALKRRYTPSETDPDHTILYDHEYSLDEKGNISSVKLTIRYQGSYDLYKGQVFLHYDYR